MINAQEEELAKHQGDSAKRHAEHEKHIRVVFEALRRLLDDKDNEPRSRIGFDVK